MKHVLRRVLKAAGFAFLGLAVLLAGLSAFFFIAGRDIDPPDMHDLLPPEQPLVEASDNMVPILMDATNLLTLTFADKQLLRCYRTDGWDGRIHTDVTNSIVLTAQEARDRADAILAANAAVFAALDAAASRHRAQYPLELNQLLPINESVETSAYRARESFSASIVWYGWLAGMNARRLRENGCSGEAVEGLLRYGEMFARLSYGMDGSALLLLLRDPGGPVCAELIRAAVDDDLADDTCVRIDAALARWAQMAHKCIERESAFLAEHMRNFLSQDRLELFNRFLPRSYFDLPFDTENCKWMDSFSKGVEWTVRSFPGYGRYAFQPNRTLSEWASAVRAVKADIFSPPFTAEVRTRLAAVEQSEPHYGDYDFRLLRPNCVGSYAVAGYLPGGTWRFVGRVAFWSESNRAIIAIARYRRKHGSPPPSLGALVPEFLDEVPRDPFDAGRQLGYDAEQGTLHTVGADGMFNGKIPKPNGRYGGLKSERWQAIRRITGQRL